MTQRVKTKYPGVYYKSQKSNLTKREEKIYYIQYRNPDGKQRHEKAGHSSKGMTDAKANQIRVQKMTGKILSNSEKRKIEEAEKRMKQNRPTIYKLWEEFKIAKANLKRISVDRLIYKNHLAKPFGDKTPEEISPSEVTRLKNKLLKTLKPATAWDILSLLRRVVNFGVQQNFCEPLSFKIEMPKVNNEKTEDLSPEQLKRLLKAIDEDENLLLAQMMKMVLFTGMRRGELFKLKWKDIDFDRGFIYIRDPKGGKDQKIPLNNSARELINNLERPYPESEYVFPGKDGNQRKECKHVTTRIRDRAGLPKDFRPLHGLRHVYASMLASSGQVDMYTLQKLLTHKTPQMTQRYAHLRDETLKKASEVSTDIINNIISG